MIYEYELVKLFSQTEKDKRRIKKSAILGGTTGLGLGVLALHGKGPKGLYNNRVGRYLLAGSKRKVLGKHLIAGAALGAGTAYGYNKLTD